MITTNNKISNFGFNFNRKSTYRVVNYRLPFFYGLMRPYGKRYGFVLLICYRQDLRQLGGVFLPDRKWLKGSFRTSYLKIHNFQRKILLLNFLFFCFWTFIGWISVLDRPFRRFCGNFFKSIWLQTKKF